MRENIAAEANIMLEIFPTDRSGVQSHLCIEVCEACCYLLEIWQLPAEYMDLCGI